MVEVIIFLPNFYQKIPHAAKNSTVFVGYIIKIASHFRRIFSAKALFMSNKNILHNILLGAAEFCVYYFKSIDSFHLTFTAFLICGTHTTFIYPLIWDCSCVILGLSPSFFNPHSRFFSTFHCFQTMALNCSVLQRQPAIRQA